MAPIFSIFHDSPKTFILQQVPSKTLISPPKPSHFGTNFRSNFDVFRVSFSDTLFSSFFQHDARKRDFGTPSKSNGSQNGAQKLLIPHKKIKNRDAGRLLLAFPAQTDDAKAAQCAHGFHFHDIDVIFTDLPSIFGTHFRFVFVLH